MWGVNYILDAVGRRRLCTLALLLICFRSVYVGLALLLSRLLDLVSAAISAGNPDPVLDFLPFAALYTMLLGALVVVCGWYKAVLVQRAMVSLRSHAASGLMCQEGNDAKNSARHLTVLGQNMDTLEKDWLGGLLDIADSASQIAIAAAMLVYINPLIAVLSIVATALPALVPRCFGRRLAAGQHAVVGETERYNARVRDAAIGNEVIRSYHMGEVVLGEHDDAARKLERAKARLAGLMAVVSGTAGGLGVLTQLAIMGATGLFALKGLVSIGSVIAVTQLSGNVISPASELSSKLAKVKACREILDALEKSETHDNQGEGSASHALAVPVTRAVELEGGLLLL